MKLTPDSSKNVDQKAYNEQTICWRVWLDRNICEFRWKFSDTNKKVVRTLARHQNIGHLRCQADADCGNVDEHFPEVILDSMSPNNDYDS